jgi:hypothetical protein
LRFFLLRGRTAAAVIGEAVTVEVGKLLACIAAIETACANVMAGNKSELSDGWKCGDDWSVVLGTVVADDVAEHDDDDDDDDDDDEEEEEEESEVCSTGEESWSVAST